MTGFAPTPDDPGLLALDDGVYDEATPAARRQDLASRQLNREPPKFEDEDEPEADGAVHAPAARVNPLTAAAFLFLAALLGASAAVALYRDRVATVLARWI